MKSPPAEIKIRPRAETRHRRQCLTARRLSRARRRYPPHRAGAASRVESSKGGSAVPARCVWRAARQRSGTPSYSFSKSRIMAHSQLIWAGGTGDLRQDCRMLGDHAALYTRSSMRSTWSWHSLRLAHLRLALCFPSAAGPLRALWTALGTCRQSAGRSAAGSWAVHAAHSGPLPDSQPS
jgi:hypothetical protein